MSACSKKPTTKSKPLTKPEISCAKFRLQRDRLRRLLRLLRRAPIHQQVLTEGAIAIVVRLMAIIDRNDNRRDRIIKPMAMANKAEMGDRNNHHLINRPKSDRAIRLIITNALVLNPVATHTTTRPIPNLETPNRLIPRLTLAIAIAPLLAAPVAPHNPI